MKPSEAKKLIEKQIADLEVEKYSKIHEIWEIEAKLQKKKETLDKLFTTLSQTIKKTFTNEMV